MICWIDIIMWNIPNVQHEWWNTLHNIVNPQNIVMDMNNVMVGSAL